MRVDRVLLIVTLIFASTLVSCQTPRAGQNELILIPAGIFLMGEDSGRASNQPQHEVYLDVYYVQETEVTRSHSSIS